MRCRKLHSMTSEANENETKNTNSNRPHIIYRLTGEQKKKTNKQTNTHSGSSSYTWWMLLSRIFMIHGADWNTVSIANYIHVVQCVYYYPSFISPQKTTTTTLSNTKTVNEISCTASFSAFALRSHSTVRLCSTNFCFALYLALCIYTLRYPLIRSFRCYWR